MKRNKIAVGDLVVFNKTNDAAIFKVTEINGWVLGVVDAGLPNTATQWTDVSLAMPATAKQLKAARGEA